MVERSEIQWREGIVYSEHHGHSPSSSASLSAHSHPHSTNYHSGTYASNGNDTWNDQEILEVFDAAIRSHRSKGKKKEQTQSKKEIRSPKNVHFATGHDENILIDPLEEELPPSLPTNNRWQQDEDPEETIRDRVSFTSRIPRVNFDLESGVSVVPDSTTHTDTEGSDCGNGGGSDSSASVNKRTQNSSRRRTQSNLKKKQLDSDVVMENVAVPVAAAAPLPPPSLPSSSPLPPSSLPLPPFQATQVPIQHHSPRQQQQQQQQVLQHPQPTLAQVPPSLPTPPLPFASAQILGANLSGPQSTASAIHSTHQSNNGVGLVAPEMETLLTDMLMAWYQSGYTTGRYYTMLEQQQQQMQQWYAYYHHQQQQQQQQLPQQLPQPQILPQNQHAPQDKF